ncbi:single-stranded-DNA-specific exonuclease RecJ [Candidatus Woesebacteria bacterium RIFCSPLOWO2_01_FULL_39_61]|uniref:Single-stranded-DNA-specific exonuclease RecJ n=1 Tax=Candidatus Woesebacteria bacterium RIFCSPHIGHO2_02_FULL_39_13 TaxID=1802505 RepID=A0A1F7Z2N5_9BACT|nr:MAG: single-stranded-DNA-specific exonuclease RecJ [Candidatus Woesebacteria bacterium RIFCSPHIGHO2_01_FULL_39_95]OGM33168.1 MAG: single-stranded-DNA-specific exonuclease RecJ [Candidatus Woesebacteria bacterium RIFCSPHIGHO2_02_FULL_39_13]OGM36347.1 MAG: single-stranded-DNA-specific exonuclease RecJ [Candidatus Woesebacteria bacterium RIFCSPHIGHO2_12_FULL_40_20]OGM67990.1 MAG: single-stranded-DNA-specific exonuclease RecJ [Candidatus Woesebacteria bacterium RIFCSPLOWO2_01_FULL_39_61]OGM74884
MINRSLRWQVLQKNQTGGIIDILLENRGLNTKKEKEEFLNPNKPDKISLKDMKIDERQVDRFIRRIKKAIKNEERIIIYGDYDADGICATAILWESLYKLSKNVTPYIPDRFSEGYGLNEETIPKLKKDYPDLSLIITVDNGIVAKEAVKKANSLGIDVIISDHHQKEQKLPRAYLIIHTDLLSGSGIAWILAREIFKKIPNLSVPEGSLAKSRDFLSRRPSRRPKSQIQIENGLELAAIGTIADQLPLLEANRSIAKFGLELLNKTKRVGILALFEESALKKGNIGTYEVNYMIAPRINAMGRMEHAIDSLRLLCTTNRERARELANFLGVTNRDRQRVVDDVVLHAKEVARKREWRGVIVLAHESYHEGVIGLAASKIVEEFWRPAIVIARSENISKASARSVSGFNIIENIRKLDNLVIGGGGHPMAAGFSIETVNIKTFSQALEKISKPLLTSEILTKSLKIDAKINFNQIDYDLVEKIKEFEPTGIGNPTSTFTTSGVKILDSRTVGRDMKHLKLSLEKDGVRLSAIGFGLGHYLPEITSNKLVSLVYTISEDNWLGNDNIQLKVKDLKID